MYEESRTIAAIATPVGTGAIGIIRVSGNKAFEIVGSLIKCQSIDSLAAAVPSHLYRCRIISDRVKEKCLVAIFKAPKSYTGEDSAEIYCHGGMKLMDNILNLLFENGASPAENGEFTKRAYLNGKMALSDAEGIIDMINAESDAGITAGYRLMSGKLSKEIARINGDLLKAVSGLEVSLDYPEEMEEDTREESKVIIRIVLDELRELYKTRDKGKIIKHGLNVAIIGAPNVGKSSLLNAILKDDRAIVSAIAGTTRDTISESIIIEGIKVNFIDTAGIRESEDDIEKLGVERSRSAIAGADIILKVIDATTGVGVNTDIDKYTLEVYNKNDIARVPENKLSVSAKTGEGIDELLEKIANINKTIKTSSGEILTNLRHQDAIRRAIEYLERAINEYDDNPIDCLLLDIKAAYMSLGEIDGSTASEKIVNDIFSRFCVGK